MHSIATPLGPGDPRRIGQFTIIGLLGVGGMGEVYLGTDGQGYVAVKRIRSRLVSGERFKREVGILCRVPLGIAPGVLAHDSTASQPWFATDYVPGVTADEAFRLRGPLPPGSLWLLLGETAAHLRAVHDAGIVHRDLKPANVMLVHDGVRLIDFGIVWAAGSALYSAVFSGNFGPAPLNHLALGTSMLDEMLLGTGLGIAIGFVAGAGTALEAVSEKENAADTAVLLKKSRANALIQLPVVGLLIGAGYGAVVGPVHGMAAGLMTPIGLVTLRSWGRWLVLARVWLPLTGKTPWSLITFLDDAHHRGVLRQAGAVYQFRHAQVERQLARQFSRRRLGAASRA